MAYVPPSRRNNASRSDRVIRHGSTSYAIPPQIAQQWYGLERDLDLSRSRLRVDNLNNWYSFVTGTSIYPLSTLRPIIEYLEPVNHEWRTRVLLGDDDRGITRGREIETRIDFLYYLGRYIREFEAGRYPYQQRVEELVHGNFFLYRDPAYNGKQDGKDIYHDKISAELLRDALELESLNILTGAVHQAWLAADRPDDGVEVPWYFLPWQDLSYVHSSLRVLQPVGVDLLRLSVIREVNTNPSSRRETGSGIKRYAGNQLAMGTQQLQMKDRLTYLQQCIINDSSRTNQLHVVPVRLPKLVSYNQGTVLDRVRMASLEELSGAGATELVSPVPHLLHLYSILLRSYLTDKSIKNIDKENEVGVSNLLDKHSIALPEDNLLWIITREMLYQGKETYTPSEIGLSIPEEEFSYISLTAVYGIGTAALLTLCDFLDSLASDNKRVRQFVLEARAEAKRNPSLTPSTLLPTLTPTPQAEIDLHNEEVSRIRAMREVPVTDLEKARTNRRLRQRDIYLTGTMGAVHASDASRRQASSSRAATARD